MVIGVGEFDLIINILRVVRMLWLIIYHVCEVTVLYVVFCECDSFRGVPNCRCSQINCIGLIESELLFVSRADVSPVCALSRVVCALLSSVAQRCILCID